MRETGDIEPVIDLAIPVISFLDSNKYGGSKSIGMKRDELLKEIARLDEEINRMVASAKLPSLDARPFPFGTWTFAIMCFAWWQYGDRIPGAYIYYLNTYNYAYYLGLVIGLVAILSTISWFLRGRGYQTKNSAYLTASRSARALQERRRELQAELRAISRD